MLLHVPQSYGEILCQNTPLEVLTERVFGSFEFAILKLWIKLVATYFGLKTLYCLFVEYRYYGNMKFSQIFDSCSQQL